MTGKFTQPMGRSERRAILFGAMLAALTLILGCGSQYTKSSGDDTSAVHDPHRPSADSQAMASPPRSADGATTTSAGRWNADGSSRTERSAGMLADSAADTDASAPQDGNRRVETWRRSAVQPNVARLMIGDNESLPLHALECRALVEGTRGRVILDYYFFNNRGAQREGTFQLRLPPGASPHYLAFGEIEYRGDYRDWCGTNVTARVTDDLQAGYGSALQAMRGNSWTQPKVAIMAPKDKAAFAYTQTVQRRIDPALLEWQGAGVFSGRVFPLQANRLHRIVLAYDMDLLPVGFEHQLDLPLPSNVPASAVTVAVAELPGMRVQAVEPAVEPAMRGTHLVYHWANIARQAEPRAIQMRIGYDRPMMLIGEHPTVGKFFALDWRADLPAMHTVRPTAAKNAVFLLDTSFSANPDQFNVWANLLQAILEKNDGHITHFNILAFNVEAAWYKPTGAVPNTAANRRAALNFVRTLALEGATDLGRAVATLATGLAAPEGAGTDVFLLSDAAATWGEDDLFALTRPLNGLPVRIIAFNTGLTGTDTRTLEHLTRQTGGAVVNVVGEAEIEAAATAHRRAAFWLRDVALPGTADVLVAGRPKAIFDGSRMLVVGRISDTGTVAQQTTLTIRLADMTGQEFSFDMPVRIVPNSLLAPRVYGQVAVGEMELYPTLERPSTAYAMEFRVPGVTCSLVMLETEFDYQRFGLTPQDTATAVALSHAQLELAKAERAMADTLGDAKARFSRFVETLRTTPGVSWNPAPAFLALIEALPTEVFEVPIAPMDPRIGRLAADLPTAFREALGKRHVDYDMVSHEAERRLAAGDADGALKGLSTLIENNPGDTVLGRDVGYSALAWNQPAQAYHLFRRVLGSRPWEPQTYLAMAQALAAAGKPALAMLIFDIGVSATFPNANGAHQFRAVVAVEYFRHLQAVLRDEPEASKARIYAARMQPMIERLVGFATADVLVLMYWNTDGTDMDLHVTEPSGETCDFNRTRTRQGGFITQDITTGYGPEMYVLRSAKQPGRYRIEVSCYAASWNRESARTKVYVTVLRRFGHPDETASRHVVTLQSTRQRLPVAEIHWKH